MSLVLYGGGLIDNRGSIAGTTFSRTRFGPTACAKTTPINVRNQFTTQARANLQSASGLWSNLLTETERQSWNAYALINPVTNVFGAIAYLSGMQWFCKCAINQTNFGVPIATTPPAVGAPSAPLSLSLVATAGTPGSLVLTWTNPALGGTPTMAVWATHNLSAGTSYANSQLRFVTYLAPASGSSDIEADWHTRFLGNPFLAGKKIFVLIFNMDTDNGLTSTGINANCIVT